jgi:predicted nucleotidyltransferase
VSDIPADPAQDPVLRRFRDAVAALYGERLDRIVLFGSRARGEGRPDSGYDVAVFLRGPVRFWPEAGHLAEITTDILFDTGAVISAKPFAREALEGPSPLMREIRREGLLL